MNYSHLIHERSLTTTPHRQKPIIEPPDYPVVFLTQKNKSDRVQLVFFVVEMRDLPYSDCYRRSIACSRRGSHGNAVLRFFKIAINPRFDDIKNKSNRVQLVFFVVEMRGFEPRSTRPSSALSTRLVGD